jgi:exopolysaccharide biosynthesis polyprenyl glycosylphosphotransferase
VLERVSQRLAGSVLFWDLVLTLFCLYATSHIRIWLPFGKELPDWHAHLPFVLYIAVFIIWLVVFFLLTPQRAIFRENLLEAMGRLLASVSLAGLSFAGLLYLSPFRDVSRLQFLYFIAADSALLLAFHVLVRARVRSQKGQGWQQRMLIVGSGDTVQHLAREFVRQSWAGLRVIGFASDEPLPDTTLPVLGGVNDTLRIVTEHQIDEVVFALPAQQHERVARLSLQLQHYPVMVHTVPGLLDLAFTRTSVGTLAGIPLISLRESVLNEPQRFLKRLFDIGVSLLALLVLSPIMLIIAVLIKLESPGPVFFLQERIGEHGKRFKMIKFRSMYQDAEKRWQDVARRDATGALIHKQALDPRITPLGQTLRRTSLDELPQLINVLRGEMSLVGPRPEMPYIVAEYEAWQWQRFRVPPGMTGWWQINGRSDKPMHLHTEDDLYYVQNYSFWLDVRIILKTIIVVLRGQGAY